MNRPWQIGLAFVLSLAVLLTTMGWITRTALRLGRAQQQAQREAQIEEPARLALWRMDSFLSLIVAQENARTYFEYSAFYPAQRAYTGMFEELRSGDVLIPSPILLQPTPYVLLHFQLKPSGELTSPQYPTGNERDLSESNFITPELLADNGRLCSELHSELARDALLALLPEIKLPDSARVVRYTIPPDPAAQDVATATQDTQQQIAQLLELQNDSPAQGKQQRLNKSEQQARLQLNEELTQNYNPLNSSPNSKRQAPQQKERLRQQELQQQIDDGEELNAPQVQSSQRLLPNLPPGPDSPDSLPRQDTQPPPSVTTLPAQCPQASARILLPQREPEILVGTLKPLWIGDKLLLVRRAVIDQSVYVQGCWLNWRGLQDSLLRSIADLLPEARVERVGEGEAQSSSHVLATIPVRLIPGTVSGEASDSLAPLKLSLWVAWICVLLAAAAVAALLVGAVALSERRGAFVSAVTHELRTPLTTFRMYTQMLAEGMVPDPLKRTQYLETLRRESDRLSHLVENVLSYARLERGRASDRSEKLTCAQLLEQVKERLRERAQHADMQLEFTQGAGDALTIQADTVAVEQILFNLIDNACKYAKGDQALIVVGTAQRQQHAAIFVRDSGPGITRAEARKLFRPFSKSAKDAASTAPGVGLGLALSRRLARKMGGDLLIDHSVAGGACFVLVLPRVV